MVRGGKVGGISNFKNRIRSKDDGSDDSDEDYVVSEEGNEESDDDAEDYCSSLYECASEEGSGSFANEEEEEKEMRNVVMLKAKHMSSARERNILDRKLRKLKSVSDEEEEDEDYEEELEGNEQSDDDAEDYCSSLEESGSEEGFGSNEEDEEEEEKELKKVVRLKARQMSSARERKIVDRKSRKRKSVSDEEDEDEDYEEEEDDDEEFTPDQEDSLDEEEELTMKKKKNNMKVTKRGLWKRGSSKHKKRKKSAVSKKPLRKRGRKKCGLKRKKRAEEEDDDCDFIDNTQIVRKKSRTNAGQRKKAYVVASDSDFVSSGSSDYEYTISEEEREQVKEANQSCGSLKTSLRSSSSSKRSQEFEELGQQMKPTERKGKEKVEETKAEVIKQVCGICLSEEDKRRLRGTLNCCSHYFCFTCIMEWSKVESRCPLCKQRFETISKQARSMAGVDLRDVVIQVPKRDQVYQPSEEELRSYLDPYENVICFECHQGGDDALMLLCDLCDSSAHTYCVGLGREVPEGNWYCYGCRPVALGSSSSQVQDSLPDQRTINNLYNRLSPIVNLGESLDSIIGPSPRMPSTPGFVGLSSPRFPFGDSPAVSPVSGVGAPTLTGRRWLHRQIQNLRSINRMNLMTGRTDGISTANMDIDFVNSHIDQSRETTVQQARTQDMGTQHQTVFELRLQDDPSSSLRSRDFFSSRLGHLRRQAVRDSTTPTFNTSINLMLWPELAGISSNEQLRRCSNGSNIGPDGCGLPFSVRDEGNFSMAKEQLQAMVRSHLKDLSNNIDLDNGTFKDIATSSMHTLLAACGLEHRRSEVHLVPAPSNCAHIERVAAGHVSLLKGCCLTCFDSFVKDVVKRIMDTRSPQWLSLGL
ncbi:tyrosine-protein kinase BAZ1B-like [Durio zibethinus]|uniref:Tyrosine-protein kinase BAZ1B-like n=1 Tax=Durio zibethinus TaxID=66656 RepID=A0A6P5YPN9_DURZI|nr:tyrosine-protein kinase BAZ1B-like [Durio zibethinus]XP_022742256.1 tyrosine-protein kinase BAZ1B-like [Durio zibethinus]